MIIYHTLLQNRQRIEVSLDSLNRERILHTRNNAHRHRIAVALDRTEGQFLQPSNDVFSRELRQSDFFVESIFYATVKRSDNDARGCRQIQLCG